MRSFLEGQRIMLELEKKLFEPAKKRVAIVLKEGTIVERSSEWHVYSFHRPKRNFKRFISIPNLPIVVHTDFGNFPGSIKKVRDIEDPEKGRIELAVSTDLGVRVPRLRITFDEVSMTRLLYDRLDELRRNQPADFENAVTRLDPARSELTNGQYRETLENIWTPETERITATIESWSTTFLHALDGADVEIPVTSAISAEIDRGGRVLIAANNSKLLDSVLIAVHQLRQTNRQSHAKPLRLLNSPRHRSLIHATDFSLEATRTRETAEVRAKIKNLSNSIEKAQKEMIVCSAARDAIPLAEQQRQELKKLLHLFPPLEKETNRAEQTYRRLAGELEEFYQAVEQPNFFERWFLSRAFKERRLNETKLEAIVCNERLLNLQARRDSMVESIDGLTQSIKALDASIAGRSALRLEKEIHSISEQLENLRQEKRALEDKVKKIEKSLISNANLIASDPEGVILQPENFKDISLVVVYDAERLPVSTLAYLASVVGSDPSNELNAPQGRMTIIGDPSQTRVITKSAAVASSLDRSLFEHPVYRIIKRDDELAPSPQLTVQKAINANSEAIDSLNDIFFNGQLRSVLGSGVNSTEVPNTALESAIKVLGPEMIHIFDVGPLLAHAEIGGEIRPFLRSLAAKLRSVFEAVGVPASEIQIRLSPLLERESDDLSPGSLVLIQLIPNLTERSARKQLICALSGSPSMLIVFTDLRAVTGSTDKNPSKSAWINRLLYRAVIHDASELQTWDAEP